MYTLAGVSRNPTRHTLWLKSIVIHNNRSIQFTLISEIETIKYNKRTGHKILDGSFDVVLLFDYISVINLIPMLNCPMKCNVTKQAGQGWV